ncbi:MAG: dihydropteroate synthase [Eggerthellaceae bacterium]|nr:dihydropteroate synthase [Eggerthellaceae bacterium]
MIWSCSGFSFDTKMPVVMGILNITPDSFSDGGDYENLDAALAHAREMVAQGASIIDVGGESTRPGADPVSPDEEWARIEPVVNALVAEGVCVSVDTRHAEVAAKAVAAGVSIINDVSGFSDPAMVELAQSCDAGLVVMHMKGEPATMQDNPTYDDVVAEVCDYLRQRAADLEAAGIAHERICLDPGPGFGKTPKQTIELMRNLHEVVRLGYPVMCAASRKGYVAYAYRIEDEDPKARDVASAAEALLACELGASVVRTHNVAKTAEGLADLRPYVLLGMGSNVAIMAEKDELRDAKIAQINYAIGQLCMLPDTQIIDIASFYASEPAYYLEQDEFVNTVVLMRTGIPPVELLDHLHGIENMLGRVRERENGPRTIDIDILDYQTYTYSNDRLILPHPRVNERDFVVKPLLEILPGHVLSDGTKVGVIPEAERCGAATRI